MKKSNGKKIKINFIKLTQAGISLIVLVITIILIVILASSIILSISNNNPVREANIARYNSDVANMQAIFTNVVAKVMAKNRATITITAGQINSTMSRAAETIGEIKYIVNNAEDVNNTSGKIIFDKGDNTDTEFYTGRKLPIYSAGETKWYVDSEGNISLEVAGAKYGAGIKTSNQGVNEYGFYYNKRYTGNVPDFGEITLIFHEDKKIEFLVGEEEPLYTNAVYSEKSIYCVELNASGVVNDDGTEVYIEDLYTTFVLEREILEDIELYYNQMYSFSSDDDEICLIFDENKKDVIIASNFSVTRGEYKVDKDRIEISGFDEKITGKISYDGTQIDFSEIDTTFSLGSQNSLILDEYIYMKNNAMGKYGIGFRIAPLNPNKSIYSMPMSNINNIPVLGLLFDAFSNNSKLTELPDLPDTIKYTGESGFEGCTGLTNITTDIFYIENRTFEDCINLKSVTLEEGVYFISCNSFKNCRKLEYVALPKTLEYIEQKVFENCSSLTDIIYAGTTEEWKKINIYENWNDVLATEVKCSDGVVPLK